MKIIVALTHSESAVEDNNAEFCNFKLYLFWCNKHQILDHVSGAEVAQGSGRLWGNSLLMVYILLSQASTTAAPCLYAVHVWSLFHSTFGTTCKAIAIKSLVLHINLLHASKNLWLSHHFYSLTSLWAQTWAQTIGLKLNYYCLYCTGKQSWFNIDMFMCVHMLISIGAFLWKPLSWERQRRLTGAEGR